MKFKQFEKQYEQQEQELLVLTGDANGAGSGTTPYIVATAYFLAWVDTQTGEVHPGEGRLSWPVESEEAKTGAYFERFKKGTVYRIKGRHLLTSDDTPKDRIPSYYNDFHVTEVLEEGVAHPALEGILAEYRKPVILEDEILGKLVLNKDYGMFEGYACWLDEEVSVSLDDVAPEEPDSWTQALNALKEFWADRQKWDTDMREFAAKELTSLANDWQDEEEPEAPDLTEADFARRITLSSISITPEGSYTAFFDDDDMFWGHAVTVYGSLKEGIQQANMEG